MRLQDAACPRSPTNMVSHQLMLVDLDRCEDNDTVWTDGGAAGRTKKNLDSNLLVFFFFIPQIVYKINKSTVGLQTRMSASIEYQPKANNSKYTNYTSS